MNRLVPLLTSGLVVIGGGGCNSGGGSGGGDSRKPPPAPRTALAAVDAGSSPADAGITALPTYDPNAGFYLDPDLTLRSGTRVAGHDHPPVSLLLRSTPVGAIASVDGLRLGVTPVVWDGDGGIAHEFTFVLTGHALARYRFVPVTNGIVHGTLARIADDAVVPALPVNAEATIKPPRSLPPPPPPIDAAPPPPPIDAGDIVDAAVVPTGPVP